MLNRHDGRRCCDERHQAIACRPARALLDTLALGEGNVTDLVATLDVTQSAVSQQLAVLKSAGLVNERVDGRFRYFYRLGRSLSASSTPGSRYRAYMEAASTPSARCSTPCPTRPQQASGPQASGPQAKGTHTMTTATISGA